MAGTRGPLSLAEIVGRLGGELQGNPDAKVDQVATLENAGPRNISFLANPRYRARLPASRAGAVILAARDVAHFGGNRILAADPYLYFARVADLLNPRQPGQPGIHPSAVIEGQVSASASVGPHAHVGRDARVGERVILGPGARVGEGAVVGEDSVLHANAVVYSRCVVGERTIIHSGAVIGADGFGFARESGGGWFKVPQIGRVVIGDDVEVGAGTTIDRGAIEDTVIEDGVKLDNQIQIGHNCRIGAHTAMAGCVGIAGSTRIGRRCTIGGAAMIIGHLTITDDVHISAGTFIAKSISEPGAYTGSVPHLPHREWLRHFAHLRRLDSMAERMRTLEQRLKKLEEKP